MNFFQQTARVPAIRGLGFLQEIPIPSNWPVDAMKHSPRERKFSNFYKGALNEAAVEFKIKLPYIFWIKAQKNLW